MSTSIRKATAADLDTLVAFTRQEALEAEGVRADEAALRRGVSAAFADPPRSTYWIVEDDAGLPIASASAVTEWSDFHGGEYWWIQSIFISEDHRGRGLLEQIVAHIADVATAAGALDLRLYVHATNTRAARAYARCGFADAPYTIMRRPLHPR